MFTGIIKDIGTITAVKRRNGGIRFRVGYGNADVFSGLSIDESVSLNGACQTVVALGDGWFEVESVEETLSKTTLGSFRNGSPLNLERAVRPLDRLGGHFVLGHVDCTADVHHIKELGSSRELWISFPEAFSPFIVSAGSITVDGISLTVAKLDALLFAVAIIPYTHAHTTLPSLQQGGRVNLEFDILGKYVARQLGAHAAPPAAAVSPIDELWLRENGF